jgi:hypothetical protein
MAYEKGFDNSIFGSSAIKKLSIGFSDYMAWINNNDDKRHFEVGRAVDAVLCQNKSFHDLCFVCPSEDEDGKSFAHSNKGKAIKEAHRSAGRSCITNDEAETIKAMVRDVHNHPIAKRFFDRMDISVQFQQVFTMPYLLDNGDTVTLRATPDVTLYSGDTIIGWADYKSTAKETHDSFIHQFKSLQYDIQAGLYSVIIAHNGAEFDGFAPIFDDCEEPVIYIGQSKAAPHSLFITPIGADVIEQGWLKVEQALNALSDGREKMKVGRYIGYSQIVKIGGFTQKEDVKVIDKVGNLF